MSPFSSSEYDRPPSKGVSLFAQHEGLPTIANYGRSLLQSQHDSTQLDSVKDVKINAKGRKIIMAEEVGLMNAAGAYSAVSFNQRVDYDYERH